MRFFAHCHLACFLTRVVVSSHFWHSIALCSLLHAHKTAMQGVRVDTPMCAVVPSMCVLYAFVQAHFISTRSVMSVCFVHAHQHTEPLRGGILMGETILDNPTAAVKGAQ